MDLKYRADIDGLRCLAILPVVLYHAFPSVISGGYVGVDIFFVISGFLITSIIYNQAVVGRFSYLYFYDRRIRRIFPALFFMLVVVCILATLVMIPSDLTNFARSLIPTATFWSNVFFWRSADYFAESSETLPLLHTWSLAVEEQFYVLFPPVVLLGLRFMGRRGLSIALVLALALSFVVAAYGVYMAPRATFYLLPTRAWELLIGSLLAIPLLPKPAQGLGKLLALSGLLMIGTAVLVYEADTPFPGLYALLPCLGAALVIYGGFSATDGPARRFLELRPVVYIGKISYSLYLWHWPLLVSGRLYFGESLTALQAGMLVLASFALAAFSLHFVEAPFRKGFNRKGAVRSLVIGGIAIAAAVMVSTLAVKAKGLPWRVSAETLAATAATKDRNPLRSRCLVGSPLMFKGQRLPPLKGCLIGPGATEERYEVIVWGDSMADALVPGVADIVAQNGWTVREIGMQGCPPLLNADIVVSRNTLRGDRCAAFNQWAVNTIRAATGIKLVVISGRWSVWSEGGKDKTDLRFLRDDANPELSLENSRRVFRESLQASVQSVKQTGLSVLVVGQPPQYPESPPRCKAYGSFRGDDSSGCLGAPRREVVKPLEYSNEVIREMSRTGVGVISLLPSDILCDEALCTAGNSNRFYYADNIHVSSTGARYIMEKFNVRLLAAP